MNEKVKQALDELSNGYVTLGCTVYDCYDIEISTIEQALKQAEESEKELIAEQHRLFDLAKEQEKELNELKEFAKLVIGEFVDVDCAKDCDTYDEYVSCYGNDINKAQFNLVKKVVEKYGKK